MRRTEAQSVNQVIPEVLSRVEVWDTRLRHHCLYGARFEYRCTVKSRTGLGFSDRKTQCNTQSQL